METTPRSIQNLLRVKLSVSTRESEVRVEREAPHAARSVESLIRVSVGETVFVYSKNPRG